MKKIYLLVLTVVSCASLFAQTGNLALPKGPVKKCASAEVLAKYIAEHPGSETTTQFESWINQKIAERRANPNFVNPIVTVPVVFHIIHNAETVGTGRNVSQAAIRQQILQINKDYANQSNSPYAVSEDMGIRFALAQNDPTGVALAEPGIDRIDCNVKGWTAPPYTVGYASASNYLTTTIKPNSIWDPTRYVNIWISEWEAGILGIATFPASSGLTGLDNSETNSTAGVAIDYTTVGSVFAPTGGCAAAYGKGKTLTHELGHFFGLRHIWGDATCGNDYCNDTPVHYADNSGEPVHPKPNSCGTADEMFENYMDYSDDIITNTFTINQGDRMEAVFANSPRRASLATSNVGLVFVTASNNIAFANCTGAMTVSESVAAGTCPKFKTISLELNVEDKATAASTVTINTGGTAVSGVDYQLMTPTVSFAAGDDYKAVNIRILDNAIASGNKTLTLSYSISGSGVTAGTTGQTISITILDDDFNAQINQTTPLVTVFSQDFGTTTGINAVPANWTISNSGTATNKFVVNNTASSYGFAGNAAHISNGTAAAVTAGTAALNYTKTTTTDARMYTPTMDATGLKNITLSFAYVANGEADYDFGVLYYSTDAGATFNIVTDANGNIKFFQGVSTLTNYSVTLPPSASGSAGIRFLFRWLNDNVGGTNPPWVIDNVVVQGRYQTVESDLNATTTQNIFAATDAYLYSANDSQLIARLTNPSVNLGCLTASVPYAGTSLVPVSTTGGAYQRSSKVIKLTPATANSTASYQVTFYYTTAELAAWGTNVPNLKILKVADNADIFGTLTSSNSQVFTPTVDDQRTTRGYVSYTINATGGFSQFLLVSPLTALPVRDLNFTARANVKNIVLNWNTASEQNNKGFAIERSTDGITFEKIDFVNGVGNSTRITNYSYTDNFVQPNVLYYYRLRQTDIDNNSRMSETRTAKITGNKLSISLSPNPATDKVKVFLSGSTAASEVRLYNVEGQLVRSWSKQNLSVATTLDVSGLAKGVYVFNILSGGQTKVEKLVIQ